MTEINERQREILAFIGRYLAEMGRPPTIREIGAEFQMSSTSAVAYHLDRLEAAGRIIRDAQTARGMRLVEPDQRPAA